MKKIFTGIMAFMLLAGAASAQTTEKAKEHKGQHGKMMSQLNLTADQQSRFKALHEQQKKEMEALKANTALTADQQKTKRKELHESYKTQYQSILTADQKAQFEKAKADRKAHKKDWKKEGRKGDRAGKGQFGKRGADFQKELGLTPDQQERMDKVRASYKGQFESLRNDPSLAADQKKAKMKELMKSQQNKFKSILTKEQLEKMQSLRKERGNRTSK
ncbi:MAG TPA: hypothetical protein VHK91_15935 [Flavisolibacter sp.]|nr:hypothetical protein [Flavisolibacter sp.]